MVNIRNEHIGLFADMMHRLAVGAVLVGIAAAMILDWPAGLAAGVVGLAIGLVCIISAWVAVGRMT